MKSSDILDSRLPRDRSMIVPISYGDIHRLEASRDAETGRGSDLIDRVENAADDAAREGRRAVLSALQEARDRR
jgi:hypothetical protein